MGHALSSLEGIMVAAALEDRITTQARPGSSNDVEGFPSDVGFLISLHEVSQPVAEALKKRFGSRWVYLPIPDPNPDPAKLPQEVFSRLLESTARLMQVALEHGDRVLVHCLGGTDRSPCLKGAFLRLTDDSDLRREGERICSGRSASKHSDYAVQE